MTFITIEKILTVCVVILFICMAFLLFKNEETAGEVRLMGYDLDNASVRAVSSGMTVNNSITFGSNLTASSNFNVTDIDSITIADQYPVVIGNTNRTTYEVLLGNVSVLSGQQTVSVSTGTISTSAVCLAVLGETAAGTGEFVENVIITSTSTIQIELNATATANRDVNWMCIGDA